jgi:hypothetical protein
MNRIYQFLVDFSRLPDGVFFGSGGIDDVVGELSFCVQGELTAETRLYVFESDSVARHGAFDLLLFIAGHQDDAVVIFVGADFDQDGRFDYDHGLRIGGADFLFDRLLQAMHGGMHDRIQLFQALSIAEDKRSETATVDAAIGIQNLAAELPNYRREGFPVGGQGLVAEVVRMNEVGSQALQRFSDEGFAAREAAGESYAEGARHARRLSAAAMVFIMSIAMVSGPTPPGTGV